MPQRTACMLWSWSWVCSGLKQSILHVMSWSGCCFKASCSFLTTHMTTSSACCSIAMSYRQRRSALFIVKNAACFPDSPALNGLSEHILSSSSYRLLTAPWSCSASFQLTSPFPFPTCTVKLSFLRSFHLSHRPQCLLLMMIWHCCTWCR